MDGVKFEKLRRVLAKTEADEMDAVIHGVVTFKEYGPEIEYNGRAHYTMAKLTPLQKEKPNAVEILRKKESRAIAKKWAGIYAELSQIEQAETPTYIELSIEWTRGGCYGPQAYAHGGTDKENATGAKTGGFGYDKASTASANLFNKLNGVKKIILNKLESLPMADIKNTLKTRQNRDAVGYGVYFWPLPYFDGGVGYCSHDHILHACGYKRIAQSSGRNYDYYKYIAEGK